MECSKCGSSWNTNSVTNNCPFCGALLEAERPECFDTVESVLKYIVDTFGADTYKTPNKVLSLMSDLTPQFSDEKRLVKLCFDAGCSEVLLFERNSSAEQISAERRKMIKVLCDKYYLQEEAATKGIDWIISSLSISSVESLGTNQKEEQETKEPDNNSYTGISSNISKKHNKSDSHVVNNNNYSSKKHLIGCSLDGRYDIKEVVGVGAKSDVYKAYDHIQDRVVAVKILKDEFLANEEFRLRFKNESKVISVLSHPNIVKVYDVSFGEKLQYIVMEHVEGIMLKEYIERQGVLDLKEALRFVVQILRALQHAHDKGIIHRDIKPQNILLLPNANIKVTDFGMARFNRTEKNINESGTIGSVHYMSPEQIRGEKLDCYSDLYSVGVMLFEMLTGKLPFESDDDISVALMQMREDAKKPSSINASIPMGLEQITLRAMQKDPADRYQSAAEFLLDLDEFKHNPLFTFDYFCNIDKSPIKIEDINVSLGLCRYCGGAFKGIIKKKCSKCGKEKDY